ncbi:MAG: PAS domain S-box protein [Thermoplasmatota archaeon]
MRSEGRAGDELEALRRRMGSLEREVAGAEERERLFRDLVENLPIGIYRTTPDGRILLANSALVRMLGFSSFSELAARNLEGGIYEPNYKRAQFKERIMKEGEIRGLNSVWTTHDGRELFVRENARVVVDRSGGVVYEGSVEDFTELRREEEALRAKAEFLEEVVTNASVGIFVLDEEGSYVLINPECGRIAGRWPGDYTGKRAGLHIHPDDQLRALSQFVLAMGGEQVDFEIRIQASDGSWRHCRVNLSPMTLMGRSHALGVVTDVTDRKAVERALMKRRSRDINTLLILALSAMARRLTPEELEGAMVELGEHLERHFRPLVLEDLSRMASYEPGSPEERSSPERLLKRFLLYFSTLLVGLDVRAETSMTGSVGRLEINSCGWLQEARASPIPCRICDAILSRSFRWTGLRGETRCISTMARSSGSCRFEFELQI